MSKAFLITATQQGNRAQIDIIGNIYEWGKNSADAFREKVKELTDKGIRDAHVYINSGGGDCFQANEIENILQSFKGNITGEGGALVGSAATYLALGIKGFVLADNCQFMIHKPSSGAYGTVREIENQLQLLKNMTEQYKKAYLAKTTMTESDFLKKWENGDWWMTALEAKQYGFVSDTKTGVEIDEATAQMIAACTGKKREDIQPKIDITMNLTTIAKSLGLPPTANQEQINSALTTLQAKANKADELEALQKSERKAAQTQEIKAKLDKAINEDKTVKADNRAAWELAFENDFDNTAKMLADITPVEKLSTQGSLAGTMPSAAKTYQGKTFEQLQDEDPELLAELETTNPDLFAGLFADWQKRNKVK